MGTESEWHFPQDSSIAALANAPRMRIQKREPAVWGPSDFGRQFCVLLFEEKERLKNKTVLDVGCGSGVLGIAAAMLGAGKVVAIDHTPAALALTTENAVANGVGDKIVCEQATFDAYVKSSDLSAIDVVICNHFSAISSDDETNSCPPQYNGADIWKDGQDRYGAQRELLFEVLHAVARVRKNPISLYTHISEEQGVRSTIETILELGLSYETLLTVPMAVNRELFKNAVDAWAKSGLAKIRGDEVLRDVIFLRIDNVKRIAQT